MQCAVVALSLVSLSSMSAHAQTETTEDPDPPVHQLPVIPGHWTFKMTSNLKPAHSDDVPVTYGSAGKGDGTPVSGTIQVTAIWVKGFPAMPPPAQLIVKLTAGAQAGAYNDSPQADDGLKDPPNITAYGPFYTVSNSNGIHLITKKTNGSTTVEIGTYTLTTASSNGILGGNYWVGLRADQDDRSITLTRQGAWYAPEKLVHLLC